MGFLLPAGIWPEKGAQGSSLGDIPCLLLRCWPRGRLSRSQRHPADGVGTTGPRLEPEAQNIVWDRCGADPGSIWSRSELDPGSNQGRSGADQVSILFDPGSISGGSGWIWGRSGLGLGSLWGRSLVYIWSIWGRYGADQKPNRGRSRVALGPIFGFVPGAEG